MRNSIGDRLCFLGLGLIVGPMVYTLVGTLDSVGVDPALLIVVKSGVVLLFAMYIWGMVLSPDRD